MRFGGSFTRTETTIGNDALDVTKPLENQVGLVKDCILSIRVTSINGFPGQRVCVGYMPPSTADTTANLYFHDDLTHFWYLVNPSPVALKSGAIVFFDTPTFGDAPTASSSASQGSMQMCLVVAAPISPPAGTYTFAVGVDISNPGT